jgi:hypothetical protein
VDLEMEMVSLLELMMVMKRLPLHKGGVGDDNGINVPLAEASLQDLHSPVVGEDFSLRRCLC